jgi:hypothetical protein
MMKKVLLCLFMMLTLAVVPGKAQSPASSPTNQPPTQTAQQPAPKDSTNNGPVSIVSSIEIGARGVLIEGNADKYRSDLNYQPGVRVFDSSFLMRSDGSNGMPMDSLLVNSTGWGADPSGYLRVNAEKTKWYKFDANVRHFDYFNSLRNLALNQHIYNTDHKMGDFDLTVLPQNERVRFNVGYSYDRNNGPILTTYDYSRDEFPIQADYRTEANNFRVGVDAKLWIFDLSFLQGWRFAKDDTRYFISSTQPGNNPTNTSVLTSFERNIPTRTRTPFSRVSLHTYIKNLVDFTGRFIYSGARSRFTFLETATGTDASGNRIVLDQFTASGNAKRPSRLGDLGVTINATRKLRISETFRVNSFNLDGGDSLNEALFRSRTSPAGTTILPPMFVDQSAFNTLSYRRYTNTIELDYQFGSRFGAHIGHRYTDRHIENFDVIQPTTTIPETETFDNRANAIIFGFRARPLSRWSIYFDLEHGSTDNVFTRTENYNYDNFRVRSRFVMNKNTTFNLSVVTRDNTNPSILDETSSRNFSADINTRIYTASADWAPVTRFSVSSGYTYTRITSEAQIFGFINSVQQLGLSRYFMRDHFGFLNVYLQPLSRVSFFGSYRIHKDTGQGDRVSTSPTIFLSSYPLQFQFPEARIAIKLNNHLDWNLGYQYFDYKERFFNNQFYHAHLPYTSLRIYFNRGS